MEDFEVSPQHLPSPPSHAFTRHEHGGNKNQNWSLKPTRPILLLGASNLSHLPLITDNRVQVDSYPGCNIAQATYLLRNKTPTSPNTKTVILHFGLNDKSRGNPTLLEQGLKRLLATAKNTFPYAEIRIALINISNTLGRRERDNLHLINLVIKRTPNHIPRLGMRVFSTTGDGIHWTPNTGREMWTHWKSHLKLGAPTPTNPTVTKGKSVINLSSTFQLSPSQHQLLEKASPSSQHPTNILIRNRIY